MSSFSRQIRILLYSFGPLSTNMYYYRLPRDNEINSHTSTLGRTITSRINNLTLPRAINTNTSSDLYTARRVFRSSSPPVTFGGTRLIVRVIIVRTVSVDGRTCFQPISPIGYPLTNRRSKSRTIAKSIVYTCILHYIMTDDNRRRHRSPRAIDYMRMLPFNFH